VIGQLFINRIEIVLDRFYYLRISGIIVGEFFIRGIENGLLEFVEGFLKLI